ncbi:maleylpyruvate isomerase family mycothiol-dependent enzyme [Actinoallomurus rhizosphaericola]|uniref:maleylpyruvate isomerase family mycothiol-dependent enzyme n=1 Tax=Actinoallomurus rhizosphaericola TaxID=2952536 RepID=UPI0020914C60|nr:maleylpyruvate isomerase family mycothiol-dependent enzyme [Actinoallomurus rhizosphaericola]MCO5993302.1 maleylpyruvate isomerase family mycothiol-dependent enzyme [Actinoallomurus rhizosphaericola]
MTALDDLDPFAIFDAEAERLDRFFSGLKDDDWARPSRCEGWTVRDVLAHLAGEEDYNHACLDDDLEGLWTRLEKNGVSGLAGFNDWCVRTRRSMPVEEVLDEWRTRNGDTRRRMRDLGRDARLPTMAGPYPVGLQAFHYASEYATHGDDVGVPVDDARERTAWRVVVGRFALEEKGSPVEAAEDDDGDLVVRTPQALGRLTPAEFVDATVGRLPGNHPLDPGLRDALRCLA